MDKRARFLGTAAVGLLLLCSSSGHRRTTLCEGFLPPNALRIPVGDVHARGLEQAAFNSVLDRAEELYAPVVAAKGARLVVNRLWEDPTVNASAEQEGDQWIINMYGGLARHQVVTTAGFALVACHELGHHLGGFPRYPEDWASNEGGSDYFATLKCLRLVLKGTPQADMDPLAAKSCAERFPAGPQRGHCLENAMAGFSIARLFQALGRTPAPLSFATPDVSVVDETDDNHPAAQCRLDTYFQGALCTKPVTEEQSAQSPIPGACTAAEGYTAGLRPRCWYKPPVGEAAFPTAARPVLPAEKALGERLDALRAALLGGI